MSRSLPKKKSGPVIAVRYFYANPYTGKEIKGKPSTTVYSPYAQARRAVAALNKGHRQYLGGLFAKGVALVLGIALSGCASTMPYKDALRRIGDVGPRIADDIKPSDAGGQARKDAFLSLCDECRNLGK